MKPKKIPKFRNEDEEREFWDTHDATDYIDWDSPQIVDFSHLRKESNFPRVREALTYQNNLYLPRSSDKREWANRLLLVELGLLSAEKGRPVEIEKLIDEAYKKLLNDDVESVANLIDSLLSKIRAS